MIELYILYTISVKKKTDIDLKTEYMIYKTQHGNGMNMTFGNFCQIAKATNDDKYEVKAEDIAYYLDEKAATEAVKEYSDEIHRLGEWTHMAIVKIAAGELYSRAMADKKDVRIYGWDMSKGRYIETVHDNIFYPENDLYECISEKVRGICHVTEPAWITRCS